FLSNRLGYGSVSILSPEPVRFFECVTGIIHRDLIQQRLYPVLVEKLFRPAYRCGPKHKAELHGQHQQPQGNPARAERGKTRKDKRNAH
ncbi:MAG: hypothetical protein ACLPG5_05010, partial [Acidocella sp.]